MIEIDIADHFLTRLSGLLFKDPKTYRRGLFFMRCNSIHTLGMRFPIDLVFLDKNLQVIDKRTAIPPFLPYVGNFRAHSILEVFTGILDSSLLSVGDQLEIHG